MLLFGTQTPPTPMAGKNLIERLSARQPTPWQQLVAGIRGLSSVS